MAKAVNQLEFIITVFIYFFVIIGLILFVIWFVLYFGFFKSSNTKPINQYSKPTVKLIPKPIIEYEFDDIRTSECECGWNSKELVKYCEKCGVGLKE